MFNIPHLYVIPSEIYAVNTKSFFEQSKAVRSMKIALLSVPHQYLKMLLSEHQDLETSIFRTSKALSHKFPKKFFVPDFNE